MRRGNAANPRQAWYDRNPTPKAVSYNANIVPAATTQRWTYTVPANRKSYVEFGLIAAERSAAAAPVGTIEAFVQYTPNGGATSTIAYLRQDTNTVGIPYFIPIGQAMLLFAGDNLAAFTDDTSTGGSVSFQLAIKVTEFDA